ncbi:MAG: CCA tRNA nucleotidyltransferase [Lachnospiraceae bacterium]|nr:CCA tRNA nucleotidyltransferase [Lachnospiraceae bacterium]
MNKPILPNDVAWILKKLNENGFEGYIVGGCVRDSIMGIAPHDWDMATSATPQEVKSIFNHTVDTGIKHGTVTVVLNGENYEITTYRVEGDYKDCRHPSQVSFTRDLHEDLLRRDFTMNAIAYCQSEGYVDIFGGIDDIERGVIRGVGDASERFREDALRMLRAIRFSVQLDFDIEEKTKEALGQNTVLIEKISVERIREELTKTIMGNALDRLPVLWETGLLKHISFDICESVEKNSEKIINQLKGIEKNTAMAYAVFLQFIDSEKTKKVLQRLKFDTKTMRLAETILKDIKIQIETNPAKVRKLASKIGTEALEALYKVRLAGGESEAEKALENLKIIVENGDCISVKGLALSGDDLLILGVQKGKAMGNILNEILDMVLENPQMNNKENLLEFVGETLIKTNEKN